jgi:hypothetical protein
MRNEAEAAVRPQLGEGEQLLWSGRPGTGFRFQPGDGYAIFFSLVACIPIYISLAELRTGGSLIHWTAAILLAIFGLYALVGRYVVDIVRRICTTYGLTGERAIIVLRLFGTSVRSVSLNTLNETTLSLRRDRSGTILIGGPKPPVPANQFANFVMSPAFWLPSFDMIDDARGVFEKLCQAQAAAQRHGVCT